ncbi:MAG: hypothetical protein ACT4P1_10055 [Sporichthyaceae bacterium]
MAKSRPGHLSGKAAKQAGVFGKTRNRLIAVAVVLGLSLGGLTVALSGNDDSDIASNDRAQTPGEKWKDTVVTDMAGMSQGALDYLKTLNDWREGKTDAATVSRDSDNALVKFLEARNLLSAREPFEPAPRALLNFRDSAELYIEVARISKLSSSVTDQTLRGQYQRAAARLRIIGDRTYDLANADLGPFVFQSPEIEGVEFTRNAEVPTFAGGTNAPGPPLTEPRPTTGVDRIYQKDRPQVSFDMWVAAIEAADIPTPAEQAKAITDGDAKALGELSDRLTAASDKLYGGADAQGERTLGTRIQLGLLVQAEAMRAAQLAVLGPDQVRGRALDVARTLALVGNRMWDDRLGVRDVGFDENLLSRSA